MLGVHAHDLTSGYRAFRAGTLRAVSYSTTRASGYAFQIELAARIVRAGGMVVEVPIQFVDRTRGRSKMSGRICAEALALVTWWGCVDRCARFIPRRRAVPS